MRTTLPARLADYIIGTRPADLPDKVRREALRSFFNIVGCMLGGARHAIVDIADRTLGAYGGPPHATVIGRGRKADALHATLINCLASSVYSFDDTHAEAVVHPSRAGRYRGPGAGGTAAGQRRGIPCGVCARRGDGMPAVQGGDALPPAKGNFAWSSTGISGGIGAAVAAGKLLQLDAARLRRAIGIALSQAAGFRVMHGTMCTPLMPAQAAQTGLRAALLAEHGFTGSLTPLEGRHGFFSVFAEQPDLRCAGRWAGRAFRGPAQHLQAVSVRHRHPSDHRRVPVVAARTCA